MVSPDFFEKTVNWKVDDIEMEGTITYPADGEKDPGLLFVAGSGPTDRDWCSPILPGKNGSGKLLAQELAKNGYSSLRFDKRASGPHVMENLPRLIGKISMETHKDEVAGAMTAFAESGLVDAKRILALTNSEGAIHACNYQLDSPGHPFAGMILTGAPGRSVGAVARTQIHSQAKQLDNGEELMRLYDEAINSFIKEEDVKVDPKLPESAKLFIKGLMTPANLPFAKELWLYDLSANISKIRVPVLVVIGKKDIQIDWKLDGGELERASEGKGNIEFYYPENTNHVLKYEESPRENLDPKKVSERYNSQDAHLDQDSLNKIIEWLDGNFGTS